MPEAMEQKIELLFKLALFSIILELVILVVLLVILTTPIKISNIPQLVTPTSVNLTNFSINDITGQRYGWDGYG
jgi:hypothetical protein